MTITEISSTLNQLIETLKDGEKGFRQAGESVQSGDLRALFNSYSLQRAKFARELQTLAKLHGEDHPEESSSLAGTMHRGWVNLKGVLTSGEDHAILAECERGEDSAVSAYEKALEEDGLPLDIREAISGQLADIRDAHDKVRDLRDDRAE